MVAGSRSSGAQTAMAGSSVFISRYFLIEIIKFCPQPAFPAERNQYRAEILHSAQTRINSDFLRRFVGRRNEHTNYMRRVRSLSAQCRWISTGWIDLAV